MADGEYRAAQERARELLDEYVEHRKASTKISGRCTCEYCIAESESTLCRLIGPDWFEAWQFTHRLDLKGIRKYREGRRVA